ncbi:MAG: metallophosphoesterase [Deltaproteobacteria bacterium]|nr:metallophosphoesterase [Deltaproteobacteria bacterium]
MIIFLLIILCLYGGINFYAFFRAKNIFHFAGKTEILIIILLLFLILAPIIIRLAEKLELETFARSASYCGYLWMAFIFLFFFINITFDLTRYLFRFFGQNDGSVRGENIFFGLAVLLSLMFVVYGFFDAQKIRVKKLEIQTEKLLPDEGRIRIVQISDVHIGLIVRDERLNVILKSIKEAKPDILVSTGDLLDGELNNVMSEAYKLAQIKPKFGKFAVTGNHEYYAGIEKALKFTQNAGFEILRDENKKVAGINIIGLEDPTGRQMGLRKKSDSLSNLFPGKNSNDFILLLKHQPTIREQKNFDLQLSGHTHGGQIFPFMFFTRLFFPKNYGYYELNKNKSVYVSGGVGTWGPPVRFFAPPEITIIDLIFKNSI